MVKKDGDGENSGSTSAAMKSPYYLAPSDNPGVALTPVVLTGENYVEWSNEMENALRSKRKSGFINGTLLMPNELEKPDEAESWKTVNSMIVGWIRTSISPSIRSSVTFTPDARKMWTDLKKRFSVGNAVRVYQLKAELAACKQEGSTVVEYFGKLTKKWDELSVYKPIPVCTCGAADKFSQENEEEKVHTFLMGLDDSRYGNICGTIVGMEPLPDINTVYQRVIREERRLDSARSETKQEAVGFTTRGEMVSVPTESPNMSGFVAAVQRS